MGGHYTISPDHSNVYRFSEEKNTEEKKNHTKIVKPIGEGSQRHYS